MRAMSKNRVPWWHSKNRAAAPSSCTLKRRQWKRLARKTGYQNIVIRDVLGINAGNISRRAIAKIGPVGLTGVFVNFRSENGLPAVPFKSNSGTPYAGEQVYEGELGFFMLFAVPPIVLLIIEDRRFLAIGLLRQHQAHR